MADPKINNGHPPLFTTPDGHRVHLLIPPDPNLTVMPDPNRIFDPTKQGFPPEKATPEHLVHLSTPTSHLFRLAPWPVGIFPETGTTTVISTAGALLPRPTPTASIGIYFGPTSPYNISALLCPTKPQTQTHAEIEAALVALRIFEGRVAFNPEHRVVVVTRSRLLVENMAKTRFEERSFVGMGGDGDDIALRTLDQWVGALEGFMLGISVEFWLLEEGGWGADELAAMGGEGGEVMEELLVGVGEEVEMPCEGIDWGF